MKARRLVFPEKLKCRVEEFDLPDTPGAHEVIVENLYGLISPGTELAMFTQTHVGFPVPEFTYAKYPFRPGYAAVGRALKVGADVRDIAPGDLVMVPCHHATHAISTSAKKVPQGLDPRRVPFAFLAEIALISVYAAQVSMGQNAAVFGLGMIGNFAAQLMQLAGARRVLAIDPVARRRQTAGQCGLKFTLDPRDPQNADLKQRLSELTAGQGCQIVVEATGVPEVTISALRLVNPCGKVVLLGSPRGAANLELYWDIHRTGISIVGAHASNLRAVAAGDIPDLETLCRDFIADGRVIVEPMITHTLPASQAEEAYFGLKDRPEEYLGVLLDLQQWS